MSTGAVASNELHLVLNASGDAAQVLRKMAGEIDKTQKGAAKSAKQMNKMATSGKRAQKSWTEFAAKWGTITAGFYAASRAVGMVVDGLESGGRAIALNRRVEQLEGGTLKVDAAMRGLLGTMNETDTQGLVILMDQIGMTSDQIEIATRYALGYAEAMGKELGPTLERVTQAFASGRATSFRALGIDAANAAEAIKKMDEAGRGLVGSMDQTGVSIKQARATWENFVSGVEEGSVTVAAALIDGFGARASEREFAARLDAHANKYREIVGVSEEMAKRLSGIDHAIGVNERAAGVALDKAAEATGMRKRQLAIEHETWTQRADALKAERSHLMWLIDRKADIRGVWDGIADSATEAMRRFMQLGMIPLAKGEAIEGSAAFTGPMQPTTKPRGGRRSKRSDTGRPAGSFNYATIGGSEASFLGGLSAGTMADAGLGGDPVTAPTAGATMERDSEIVAEATDRTLESVTALADGFAYASDRIGGSAGAIALAMSSAVGAIGDKNGASSAIKVAGGLAAGVTGAMAGMAWAMVPFEIAQSAAAFATGNVAGGIQHAFAAVNYGIAAGRGKGSGSSGSGSGSGSTGAGFSAGTDFGQDRATDADQSPTYIYYVQTSGGDIVAGDQSAGSWIMGHIGDASEHGDHLPMAAGRRFGRGNSFSGSSGSGM